MAHSQGGSQQVTTIPSGAKKVGLLLTSSPLVREEVSEKSSLLKPLLPALQPSQKLVNYADEEDLAGLMAREDAQPQALSLVEAVEKELQKVVEDRPSAGICYRCPPSIHTIGIFLYHLLGGLSTEGESDRAIRFLSARSCGGKRRVISGEDALSRTASVLADGCEAAAHEAAEGAPRKIGPQIPAEYLQMLREERVIPEEEGTESDVGLLIVASDRLLNFRNKVSRACLQSFLLCLRNPHMGRGGVGCVAGEAAAPMEDGEDLTRERILVSYDASILPIEGEKD